MTVPISNITATWSNSANTYTGIGMNVTSTAYSSESKLINLKRNGSSKFSVDADGNIFCFKVNATSINATSINVTSINVTSINAISLNITTINVGTISVNTGTINANTVTASTVNTNTLLIKGFPASTLIGDCITLTGTTPTIDPSVNSYFNITITGTTTFSINASNLIAGKYYPLVLTINNYSGYAFTLPSSVNVYTGTDTVLRSSYFMYTIDAGANWYLAETDAKGASRKNSYWDIEYIPSYISSSTYTFPGTNLLAGGVGAFAMHMTDDGTRLYVVDSYAAGSQNVKQYSLSTAWDVSTISFVGLYKNIANETTVRDVFIKSDDGKQMYVCGEDRDGAVSYTLGTAYTVSTASYVAANSKNLASAMPAGGGINPTSIFFKPDGTSVYIIASNPGGGTTANTILQFALSKAWNVNTATYTASSPSLSQSTGASGSFGKLYIRSDGLLVYYTNKSGGDTRGIYSARLTTPWDISTFQAIGSESGGGNQTLDSYANWWKIDGSVWFDMEDGANTIIGYSI